MDCFQYTGAFAMLIAEKPTRILSAANDVGVTDNAKATAKLPKRTSVLSLGISSLSVFFVFPADAAIQSRSHCRASEPGCRASPT